ncbi:MAG: hypothetical protein A3J42_02165 [Candidatus Dadabacteria bacterium RIFCSPHIGHO2_12_FULL_53_21]|nr:MAG: hypothetical protein A3J42_02165 [Candidatus Dadabacteria bacterium RIFCSPHIGHO2_12_FULL_53_21]
MDFLFTILIPLFLRGKLLFPYLNPPFVLSLSKDGHRHKKDEILNILVPSKNYRGIMALLHSAYGIRFLHTFRTVVQDDYLIFNEWTPPP